MAIEAVSATVPLKAGERLAGLNHVAELRARYWGDSWKEVERFVDDMRDKRDPQFEENTRALAAIFFLAKIPAGSGTSGILCTSWCQSDIFTTSGGNYAAPVGRGMYEGGCRRIYQCYRQE